MPSFLAIRALLGPGLRLAQGPTLGMTLFLAPAFVLARHTLRHAVSANDAGMIWHSKAKPLSHWVTFRAMPFPGRHRAGTRT